MKRNNFMDPNGSAGKLGAAAVPRRTVISGDPFTNAPSSHNHQTRQSEQSNLVPLLNTGKPLLSNRPVSAYVRQGSSAQMQAGASTQALHNRMKTKPFTTLHEQIQDLQQKELNLEKARTDLFLNAEATRHKQELEELGKQHEAHVEVVRT